MKKSSSNFLSGTATAFSLATVIGISSISFVSNASTFSDTSGHWGEENIEKWAIYNVISGYNGKFNPDDNITRGEMAVILDAIMDYQVQNSNRFSDLGNTWYTEAILKCNAADLMLGTGNSKVEPEIYISREDACVMIAKALHLPITYTGSNTGFADNGSINTYAQNAVLVLKNQGLISGKQGNLFAPQDNVTRAEVTTMLAQGIDLYLNQGGTYTESTTGTVVISSDNVTLTNTHIQGDLILAEGLADGDVHLSNVQIDGDIIVKGGGSNSVYLTDVTALGQVSVDRADDSVRLVFSGESSVAQVNIQNDARIETSDFEGYIGTVAIEGGSDVSLDGEFARVENSADNATITLEGEIGTVENNATGVDLTVEAEVTTLVNTASDVVLTINGEVSSLENSGASADIMIIGTVDSFENSGTSAEINIIGTVETFTNEAPLVMLNLEGILGTFDNSGDSLAMIMDADAVITEMTNSGSDANLSIEGEIASFESSTDVSVNGETVEAGESDLSGDDSSSDDSSSDSSSSDSSSSDSSSSDSSSSDSSSSDDSSSDDSSSDDSSSDDSSSDDSTDDTTTTPDPDEETPDPEPEEPEIFDPELEEPEIFDPELEEPEIFDPELEEPEIFDPEIEEPEIFDPELEEPEIFDPELEEPEIFDPELEEPEIFDPELEEPEIFDPELEEPEDEPAVDTTEYVTLYNEAFSLENNDTYTETSFTQFEALRGLFQYNTANYLPQNTEELAQAMAEVENALSVLVKGYAVTGIAEGNFSIELYSIVEDDTGFSNRVPGTVFGAGETVYIEIFGSTEGFVGRVDFLSGISTEATFVSYEEYSNGTMVVYSFSMAEAAVNFSVSLEALNTNITIGTVTTSYGNSSADVLQAPSTFIDPDGTVYLTYFEFDYLQYYTLDSVIVTSSVTNSGLTETYQGEIVGNNIVFYLDNMTSVESPETLNITISLSVDYTALDELMAQAQAEVLKTDYYSTSSIDSLKDVIDNYSNKANLTSGYNIYVAISNLSTTLNYLDKGYAVTLAESTLDGGALGADLSNVMISVYGGNFGDRYPEQVPVTVIVNLANYVDLYQVNSVKVNGVEAELTADGYYCFYMPAEDVSLVVDFGIISVDIEDITTNPDDITQ